MRRAFCRYDMKLNEYYYLLNESLFVALNFRATSVANIYKMTVNWMENFAFIQRTLN